jgi:hypothetical protein
MTFREATDALIACGISLGEFARALGVSRATVQQARAPEGKKERRPEPQGWTVMADALLAERRDLCEKTRRALHPAPQIPIAAVVLYGCPRCGNPGKVSQSGYCSASHRLADEQEKRR